MADTTPDAKQIARAFYESYNEKDLDTSFDTYIDLDLVNHALGGGFTRQNWMDSDKPLFTAFEEFELRVLDQVADGDKVATRYELGGTQTGEFFGIAPSNVNAFLSGTAIDRIADGKIVEHWVDLDFTGWLAKLSTPQTAA